MKSEESTYSTKLQIGQIRQVLRTALGNASISDLQFDALDEQPDFGFAAEKTGLIGGSSAIQVHVNDAGEQRHVGFVALGDGGFARAWSGARNSVSLPGSRKLVATSVEALKRADSALTLIG